MSQSKRVGHTVEKNPPGETTRRKRPKVYGSTSANSHATNPKYTRAIRGFEKAAKRRAKS